MAFFFFGTFLYVSLLLLNAIAILSEDRFLAKSQSFNAFFIVSGDLHPIKSGSPSTSILMNSLIVTPIIIVLNIAPLTPNAHLSPFLLSGRHTR